MSFIVQDVYTRAKLILGACSQTVLFDYLTEGVEVLANTGDFDPLLGYVDLCVQCGLVTMPREVDTILSININGQPAIGRDALYRFHLNGPGDCGANCRYAWEDRLTASTQAELTSPSKLISFVDEKEDAGKELWAYGFGDKGEWIRSKEGDVWIDGYRVPTIFGYAIPDSAASTFSRVVRVRKVETVGRLTLASFDVSSSTGTLIGLYDGDETNPEYRRIRLDGINSGWVRVAYRKRIYKIKSMFDWIPLPSATALMMILRALKYYNERDLVNAMGFESTARRLLTEAHMAHTPPVSSPLQVNDRCGITDHRDQLEP